jgi:hypothetical protein
MSGLGAERNQGRVNGNNFRHVFFFVSTNETV